MTPEERQLVAELFDRLATLEREPRDSEAERLIQEGLRRAPHAVYSLVQTALLQDEALRAADEHIARLEQQDAGPQSGSFLSNRRDNPWSSQARGSVPQVPGDRPMGAPAGYGGSRGSPYEPGAGGPTGGAMGAPMGGGMGGGMGGMGGGGFLGTAAAVAAGAIGGGLLMNGIRSALGGQSQSGERGPFSGAFDQLSGKSGESGGSPWSGGRGSDELSRQAGVDDIGRGGQRFAQNDVQDDAEFDDVDDTDFDADDSDSDTV